MRLLLYRPDIPRNTASRHAASPPARAVTPVAAHRFTATDAPPVGRESAGGASAVFDRAAAWVGDPMAPGMGTLNVAQGAAMVPGEAWRRTLGFREGAS